MAEPTTTIRIGPDDHGRRMDFLDFRDAEASPGYRYELARGVVHATQIPGGSHAAVLGAIHRKLSRYWDDHLDRIELVAGGASCRLEAPEMMSERHPDCAVYVSPRPTIEPPWADWVPEIVIEVVSKGGEDRDYNEKRADYLAVGVQEYWIVDPDKRTMLVLTRRGDTWAEQALDSEAVYRCRRLPGFELSLAEVFRPLEPRTD